MTDSVTFMSYNLTGADTVKCQWVNDTCSENSVNFCALQEHFKVIKSTENWFRGQFKDYNTYVIPAHRSPGVDCGRAKGVLVQLTNKGQERERVMTSGPRVQCQLLNLNSVKIVWINSYLRCDPQHDSVWRRSKE